MPPVVGAIVTAVLGQTFIATVVTLAIDALINFGIGKLIQSLAGNPKLFNQSIQTITIKGSVEPRRIIYGQVATSGVIIWEGTSGDHNQYLWFVVALAGHQCEEISDVWLDADYIPSSDINGSTGLVSTSKYGGKLYIWKKLGPSTEIVLPDLDLAAVAITGDSIGYGVCKLIVRCEQDSTAFPSGAPQTIRALVKGKRVYDPRLDSTNGGSGSHRLADATTWQYSANSILCGADYLHGGSMLFDVSTPIPVLGMGLDPVARVNWSFVAAGANTCDESVNIPGSTTQARFALGLVLSCGDENGTNMDKILATCIGQRVWVSGMYRLYAGAFDDPATSITDDDLSADGYTLQGALSQTDLYNQVCGIYYDPSRDWQQEPCAVQTDSTYITEDGAPILRNLALDGITNDYRAQRICRIVARQSRNQLTPILNCKLSADRVAPWEVFNLTLVEEGITAQPFRCLSVSADLGARRIQLTAKEESSSAYADPDVGDYATPGSAAPTNTLEHPSAPSNLQAVSVQDGIIFTWTASTYFPIGASYDLYEKSTATPFSSATLLRAGLSVTTIQIYKGDTTERYYWIQARSAQGEVSDAYPNGNGVAGKAASNTSSFFVEASPAAIVDNTHSTSSITTASTTVTPTNGASPFTYAWTWDSGGTGITIDSASSATTTFTSTGLSSGETRTGQAKCTVTDNAAAVRTTTVSVSITRKALGPSASVSPSTITDIRTTTSITTIPANVTASDGTPGYTYAWTWHTGGTGITINSASSSSTTFTATGLSVPETRTGTARCTVTDSASQTTFVDVYVDIERDV